MHFKRVFARKVQIVRDDEVDKEKTTTIMPENQEETKAQDSVNDSQDEP